LTSPADGATATAAGTSLTWTAPTSWGTECGTAARKYKVYWGTTNPPAYDASKDQTEGGTTTSFYPNLDGHVDSYSSTYTAAKEGTGTLQANPNLGAIQMGQALFSPTYYAEEGFLSFDTSSLGAGTTITAATLVMRGKTCGGGSFTLEARQQDWGTTLDNADFVPGSGLAAKTLLASYTVPTWNVGGANNTFTSNGSNLVNAINKTGSTRFIINSSLQIAGTAPTGDNQRVCADEMESGTSLAPRLDITYASTPSLTTSTGTLTNGQTYYWKIGAVNKDSLETPSSIYSFTVGPVVSTSTTIFVNGDLTINDNLSYDNTKMVALIVNGQIKIKSTVTVINAYVYAENGITTSYDLTTKVSPLVINGGVAIGNGANGNPVVVNFNRNTNNPTSGSSPCPCSAEVINYDPRILTALTSDPSSSKFGSTGVSFTEVNP
jgi:hypothetical protein